MFSLSSFCLGAHHPPHFFVSYVLCSSSRLPGSRSLALSSSSCSSSEPRFLLLRMLSAFQAHLPFPLPGYWLLSLFLDQSGAPGRQGASSAAHLHIINAHPSIIKHSSTNRGGTALQLQSHSTAGTSAAFAQLKQHTTAPASIEDECVWGLSCCPL